MKVWIKVFAPGIGDLVVILPILHRLKREYCEEVNVLVFNDAQVSLLSRVPWVDTVIRIGENMDGTDIRNAYVPEGHFYVDIAETEIEANYWWGSEEYIQQFGHMHIYEVMEKAIQIKGDYDLELKLNHTIYNSFGHTILLGVGGRRANKLWTVREWKETYERLVNEGYKVFTVGAKDHNGSDQLSELEKLGVPHLATKTLAETIDVISSSAGMITIDSGLMHIAAMQGIPTLALFGPMPSWLWGPKSPNVLNLDGTDGVCNVNCSKAPLDWECVGRPCMTSFTAKDIVNVFLNHKAGEYSL